MRTKFYDRAGGRLVYAGSAATDAYWDKRWEAWLGRPNPYQVGKIDRRNRVVRFTQRYLPVGSRVLEGGCGTAVQSFWLHQLGYRTVALDYASRTIDFLKETVPEIGPVFGDVRKLAFEDGSFDGYWSLGVIEHFYGGYTEIRDEAARVLRPGGYLFLTFPQMNPVRRVLARAGRYVRWSDAEAEQKSDFYQFALEPEGVHRSFKSAGFELVHTESQLGLDGLVDESRLVTWARDRSRGLSRKIWGGVNAAVGPVAGHLRLTVFRRAR